MKSGEKDILNIMLRHADWKNFAEYLLRKSAGKISATTHKTAPLFQRAVYILNTVFAILAATGCCAAVRAHITSAISQCNVSAIPTGRCISAGTH